MIRKAAGIATIFVVILVIAISIAKANPHAPQPAEPSPQPVWAHFPGPESNPAPGGHVPHPAAAAHFNPLDAPPETPCNPAVAASPGRPTGHEPAEAADGRMTPHLVPALV